ncbi:MAG: PEP-CTERM sorting domain-containing protein [Phycisphaerales bacterium]|nr:PEP-CTERM sorting domain-containing protein [Phycisphaerales bacterium]
MRSASFTRLLAAGVSLAGAAAVLAAPITPGNLVIYRVGTGGAALSTAATAVFLDEYTTAGTLVQSIPLSTAGNDAFSAVGNATTEGIISLSQDGTRLNFTGYRKATGGTSPASDTPATTNRVVGWVDLSGVPDVSTTLTDTTGTIRSATTVNGSTYYVSTSTSVRYVGTPGPATTSVSIDNRNSRQVNLADNILYASNGSTTVTGKVQHYGTLPVGATAATPAISLALADAVNGFVLFDLDAGVAGADTMYVLSTVQSQLQKYTYDGVSWTLNGTVSTAASNLTGIVSGSSVALFLTTASTLSTITDASGFGGTLSGSLTPIASAAASTGFRGIGVIPEPTTAALVLAGALLLGRRRG